MRNTLHERDFHAWANEQAQLLRAGNLSDADIEAVATYVAEKASKGHAKAAAAPAPAPAAASGA